MATIVDFSTGANEKIAEPLWQWDYCHILKITGLGNIQVVQVHFCDRSSNPWCLTKKWMGYY